MPSETSFQNAQVPSNIQEVGILKIFKAKKDLLKVGLQKSFNIHFQCSKDSI